MKLTDVKYIRQLMDENGVAFQKKFGQNFLSPAMYLKSVPASAS